jgi:hypothetical protein
MGQTTPNMGIYIPSAGETNYEQSFAAGMMNIDQHDHSGGPNKGVPIQTSGLADFSVTYDKLNANVADPTTGIGTQGAPFQNRLQALGILQNLFVAANGGAQGFISMNGAVVAGRTFQDSSTVTWTNPDGIAGNPSAAFNIAGISPVTVPNGGTGRTSFTNPYALITANTTTTGALQQPTLGTAGQVFTSNGAGAFGSFQDLPTPPTQNVLTTSITLTAAQFRALSGTPQVLVPGQGAGTVIVVYRVWGKLNYAGTDPFHDGSSVRIYWGTSSDEVGFVFTSGSFKDGSGGAKSFYYSSDITNTSSSTGYTVSQVENRNVTVSVNSSNFTGGSGNTVTFWCSYSVMSI